MDKLLIAYRGPVLATKNDNMIYFLTMDTDESFSTAAASGFVSQKEPALGNIQPWLTKACMAWRDDNGQVFYAVYNPGNNSWSGAVQIPGKATDHPILYRNAYNGDDLWVIWLSEAGAVVALRYDKAANNWHSEGAIAVNTNMTPSFVYDSTTSTILLVSRGYNPKKYMNQETHIVKWGATTSETTVAAIKSVNGPSIIYFDNEYYMVWQGALTTAPPDPTEPNRSRQVQIVHDTSVYYAISDDGIHWNPQGNVPFFSMSIAGDTFSMRPGLAVFNNRLYVFCPSMEGYIFYASFDKINKWTAFKQVVDGVNAKPMTMGSVAAAAVAWED